MPLPQGIGVDTHTQPAGQAAERCAVNVRRLRQARELSVSELARRSGVAKGTLSTLEAGAGNPTLDTLWALAATLGVPVADLLTDPDAALVVREGDGARLCGPAMEARVLDRVLGAGVLDFVETTFRAGELREVEGSVPGTITRVFVLDGRLEVRLPDLVLELGPRDFARFESSAPHAFLAEAGDALALTMVAFGPGACAAGLDPLRGLAE